MSAIPASSPSPALTRRRNTVSPIQIVDTVMRPDRPFTLETGRMLKDLRVAYRLVGDTSRPVVLVLGGISADRWFWTAPDEASKGWWQAQFGAGAPGDAARFCFLSFDYLGGCGDTTGPANWNDAAARFPRIDSRDQASVISGLLDHLGIRRLHSIVGASYGGMVALQFAATHPDRLEKALVLCAGHEPAALASGWRHVQRRILRFGIEQGDPQSAMKIARSLAMCTYRSGREFARRFPSNTSGQRSLAAYLDHCGDLFCDRFDIHAYRVLSRSLDDHRVDPAAITIPLDLVGFSSDQLVPANQMIELRKRAMAGCRLRIVETIYGHDAFLKETGKVGSVIRKHLEGWS